MVASWWYFAASCLLLVTLVYPWSWNHAPKQSYNKLKKSVKIANYIGPRCHRKHVYMMNQDDNDDQYEDSPNGVSDDEDYEIFENTPDFTTLGHKIASTTEERMEVLFIKLVMSRVKVVPQSFVL